MKHRTRWMVAAALGGAVLALNPASRAQAPEALAPEAPQDVTLPPAVVEVPDVAAATGAAVAPVDAPPVNAVWVEHKLNFTYFGLTTYYSCDGLRNKMIYLLEQAGARPGDLRVLVSCIDPVGPQFMPSVRIRAAVPTVATPEVLAKLAEDAPERALIARVQGKTQDADAAMAPFPATWRTVEIQSRRNRRIEDGDCELIEQLTRRVLVPMGIRVAEDSQISCAPYQVRLGAVDLRLHALQKLPEPDEVLATPN